MAQAPEFQNIPFITGKSLSKSHNIGIRIQETKSLMNTQLKIPKSKQKLQPEALKVENSAQHSSLMSFKVLLDRDRKTTCPALKHSIQMSPNVYYENEFGKSDADKNTVEEMWADYMFQIENKTIVPVKCTCSTTHDQKQPHKQTKGADIEESCQPTKAKKKQSTMYLEARKIMNKCREAFNGSEKDIISNYTDTTLEEDYNKKTTGNHKIARYMRQIKQIQEHLTQ